MFSRTAKKIINFSALISAVFSNFLVVLIAILIVFGFVEKKQEFFRNHNAVI